jgi:S-adenosylmethionine:tRNA ribosyltransferase-isomerase
MSYKKVMETSLFSFELPEDLIAQYPPARRGTSRLLVLDRQANSREHKLVTDLPGLIAPGTVVVFNDSRVRKARLFGQTLTDQDSNSKAVEFLLLREHAPGIWQVLTNKARQQKTGKCYLLPGGRQAEITGEHQGFKLLRITPPLDEDYLEKYGHVPLPPYIKREDVTLDAERYQTVYANTMGSAAAPTAGLHFTSDILEALRARGAELHMLTLHVGLGTFLPIRTETIEEHRMHTEEFRIEPATAAALEKALAEKRKILAVGTTSVRALESAYEPHAGGKGRIKTGWQKTDIFIYPGYHFNVVTEIFTNFHTPGSTLLLLVSAFAGIETIKETYRLAIRERYRFFSYGDAMLIR